MEQVCGGAKPYLGAGHLDAEHLRIKDKAIFQVSAISLVLSTVSLASNKKYSILFVLSQFVSKRKMGGEEFSQKYLEQLDIDLEDEFTKFKAHNESKNIFKAARTPAVFFAIAIVMYILSGVFGLFGIYTFANFCNLIMGIALLTLTLWAYIR